MGQTVNNINIRKQTAAHIGIDSAEQQTQNQASQSSRMIAKNDLTSFLKILPNQLLGTVL